MMRLKKFFAPASDATSENDTPSETLNFNPVPKIIGPITCAMKKLMDHKSNTCFS